MVPVAVVAALVAAAVLGWVRRRGTLQRGVLARGWDYRDRFDQLASSFTMPPFVHLPEPGEAESHVERWVRVTEVVTFIESGSIAHSMVVTDMLGDTESPELVGSAHVVALHTRQRLPRTIVRAGIDVYELPTYEGLQRVLKPRHATPTGVLSVLSDDPGVAGMLPLDRVSQDLWSGGGLTLVTDGDWVYAFQPGAARLDAIDSMMVTVQKLARGYRGVRWPGPDAPGGQVYGAV